MITGYIVVGLAVFGFVLMVLLIGKGDRLKYENEARIMSALNAAGIEPESRLLVLNYISGHPEIDSPTAGISLFKADGKIGLYHIPDGFDETDPFLYGAIPLAGISGISVEDKTTIEKRVTVSRLLLTGVFALAWQKKKVDEAAYMVIEWNDGRFDHETVFEFTGKGAMQEANAARNRLIIAAG